MTPERDLLLDISVALAVALAGGWLARRLHMPTLLGYIAAGVVISPFTPGFVGDVNRISLIADIGVVLLVFGIGLQFSLDDIREQGFALVAASVAQVVAMVVLALGAGRLLGLTAGEAAYIGAATAISSTVVIGRLVASIADVRAAITWSVVQDITAVVIVLVLESTAGASFDARELTADIAWTAVKALAFLAAMAAAGIWLIPRALGRVDGDTPSELFVLAVAALALGAALASEYAGLSLAFGAFVAGLMIGESELSRRVLNQLLPARDVFAVLFFVSAGMLVRPGVLVHEWPALLGIIGLIAIAKTILIAALMSYGLGVLPRRAWHDALLLIPVAEFAFLIARSGFVEGELSSDSFAIVIAAAIASISITPPLLWAFERLAEPPRPHAGAQPSGSATRS